MLFVMWVVWVALSTGSRDLSFSAAAEPPRGDRVARGPPRPVPIPSPKRGDISITDSDELYGEFESEAHPLSESYPDFQGSKSRGISSTAH